MAAVFDRLAAAGDRHCPDGRTTGRDDLTPAAVHDQRATAADRRAAGRFRRSILTEPSLASILHHMAKSEGSQLDRTFAALVDPTRRAILARLEREESASIGELARPFAIKLPAVMKHLDVLGTAGLITRSKKGRTVAVRLAPGPMEEAMNWLRRYERFWSASFDRLTAYAEAEEAKTQDSTP